METIGTLVMLVSVAAVVYHWLVLIERCRGSRGGWRCRLRAPFRAVPAPRERWLLPRFWAAVAVCLVSIAALALAGP